MRRFALAFVAPNAGLPVPVGVARPDTVKLVAYRVFFHAIAAIARFPAGERVVAGASFCFFVGGIIITGIGVGAVAIGFREPLPVVLVRGCFPIGSAQVASRMSQFSVSVWLGSRLQVWVWVLFPLDVHPPQSCPVE